MVALEIWYDVDADDPTLIRTPEELDAVLDAVAAWPFPGQLQLLIADDPGQVVLDVGIDGTNQRGVLFYSGPDFPDAYASRGSDIAEQVPVYYYMGSDTEFPATAEIPLADVRRAAHEYMSTGGGRPSDVAWQVWTD
ncbi:Imm1 family immunity protein [Lentzea chajnantorensis]